MDKDLLNVTQSLERRVTDLEQQLEILRGAYTETTKFLQSVLRYQFAYYPPHPMRVQSPAQYVKLDDSEDG